MVEHWLAVFNGYFMQPSAVKAVVAGLVTSWCATQGWKFHPRLAAQSALVATRITRLMAFVFGFGPVAVLWPVGGPERWVIAFAVGIAAPAAYTLTMRIAYHFFPWLEAHTSARPAP